MPLNFVPIANIKGEPGDTTAATAAAEEAANTATSLIDNTRSSCRISDSDITATKSAIIYVCSNTVELEQLSLAFGGAVTQSNTNYWTIEIVAVRSGVSITVASKTTKTTPSGGQAIAANVGWSFDLSSLGHIVLTENDCIIVKATPTGAPSPLVAPAASFRVVPSSNTDVSIIDSFDRADSATTLGLTDTGDLWMPLEANHKTPTWGIDGNKAYMANTNGAPADTVMTVIESNVSDCTIQVKYSTVSSLLGPVFRMSDSYNGFTATLNAFHEFKGAGRVYPALLPFTVPYVAGDTIRIVLAGPQITAYRQAGSVGDFVLNGSATSSWNVTETLHGMATPYDTSRFDDFAIFT